MRLTGCIRLLSRSLSSTPCFTSTEARWLIGDGGGGRKSEGSTADTARKRPERLDRRQNNGSVKAVSPRHCPATSAIAVSTAVLGQSHKDNVRCTAVEEQLEAKEVQLSQPSSTSLLMISSGLMKVPAPPPSSRSFGSRLEPCARSLSTPSFIVLSARICLIRIHRQ